MLSVEIVILKKAGEFYRSASAGSIKINTTFVADNPDDPDVAADILPPNQVRDLKARANSEYTELTLTFTSPGDDYEDGNATSYVMQYSKNLTDLVEGNDALNVTTELIVEGSLVDPLPGGEMVTIVLDIQDETIFEKDSAYFFIVYAIDDAGNTGKKSNSAKATTNKLVLDIIPPKRIDDLSADYEKGSKSVKLTFSSPGDDDVEGKPQRYVILYSWNEENILIQNENASAITPDMLNSGDLENALNAGETVTFEIDMTNSAFDEDTVYFFGAYAIDDVNSAGKISNIVTQNPYTGLGGGEIAGIVIGCLAAVALVGMIGYFVMVKKGVKPPSIGSKYKKSFDVYS